MQPPSTSGSRGRAILGRSNITGVLANWSLPEQFRSQAVRSISSLLAAASEGSLLAQVFTFDIPTGTSLTTLIVVVSMIAEPTDPNLPFSVAYVTINTNAALKQLQSLIPHNRCFTCRDCFWTRRCCCKYEPYHVARGHTMEEMNIVKQKMSVDQFDWFNQQNLTSRVATALTERALSGNGNPAQEHNLIKTIDNFLSNPSVKAEVLASYNDSLLSAIQSNFTSLKQSSEVLKSSRIERNRMAVLLSSLAEEHGFEDFYANPAYAKQIESPRFSYENLYTTQSGTENRVMTIKYVWTVAQQISNSTYSLYFLSLDITSKALIQRMLSEHREGASPSRPAAMARRLNVVRLSTFASNGEFLNETIMKQTAPWPHKSMRIVLNMLRFLTASVLVPQKFRMLSSFDPEIQLPGTNVNNGATNQPRNLALKIQALASSISSAAAATKDVINTLKSSRSTTITRIVRFGFNYFNQRSTILKAIDIPASRADEFVNAVILDYNLPSKGSFMLGLTYSSEFAWDRIEYLYSPTMNGKYRSLTLFKNGDSTKNTASFFIVDINSDWTLAPDLLLITKEKSILGGLFSSSKQSIQEVPHVLTLDEAVKLQQFFMLIAMGNIANTLGVNATSFSKL